MDGPAVGGSVVPVMPSVVASAVAAPSEPNSGVTVRSRPGWWFTPYRGMKILCRILRSNRRLLAVVPAAVFLLIRIDGNLDSFPKILTPWFMRLGFVPCLRLG